MNRTQIKNFFVPYNRMVTLKLWALPCLIFGLILLTIGIVQISMYYEHIQFIGENITASRQPSLIEGWVQTVLGIVFYGVGSWGITFPQKIKEEQK